MVHGAVGILLQFREKDVEQEEEEETWVKAMKRMELLSVSYSIIFNIRTNLQRLQIAIEAEFLGPGGTRGHT